MSQTSKKSLTESIIMTLIGTFFGFFITFLIFPLFGLPADFETVSGITIVFMFIGIVKNYLVRRLFNWMHYSPKVKFLTENQKWNQSLFESSFQTTSGTIVSFLLSIVIYPLFGIEASVLKIGGISIVYMIVSLLKNLLVRRYFEKIKIKVN
jgi:hypothetical protein